MTNKLVLSRIQNSLCCHAPLKGKYLISFVMLSLHQSWRTKLALQLRWSERVVFTFLCLVSEVIGSTLSVKFMLWTHISWIWLAVIFPGGSREGDQEETCFLCVFEGNRTKNCLHLSLYTLNKYSYKQLIDC